MQTSEQIKHDIMYRVMHRLNDSLDAEQMQEVKVALDIELYKINMSEETTEVVEYEDTYYKDLAVFLSTKRVEGRSEETLKRYKDVIVMMLEFFNKPVGQITTEDLRYYLAWYKETRDISLATLDGLRLIFCSFFKFLHREQRITVDPTSRLTKIKYTKKVKDVITDETLELLRANCDNLRDYALLEFLYATGVRIGELVSLNRNDVNFRTYELVVLGKGNKQRTVRINGRAAIRLSLYLQSRDDTNEALFVNRKSPYDRITKNGARAALKRLATKAGVSQNIFPHGFRTKFATDMCNHGAPIDQVAILLGHESINTTKIYTITQTANVNHTYQQCYY